MALDKKPSKKEREKAVLLGLVDLYIKTGKPVGSQTLQENGFDYVSPATIRNYFAKWETMGFLSQQHASGGRVPTTKAFREYVNLAMEKPKKVKKEIESFFSTLQLNNKEVIALLEKSAEKISELTGGAVFLLTPYFDQDFIQTIKLFRIDEEKILALLLTDFGEIKTEMLYTSQKLTDDELKHIEKFLLWKIGKTAFDKKNEKLSKIAQKFYAEIMLRQISSYGKKELFYRTGLAKLIQNKQFSDPLQLTKILTLFEDQSQMETILKESLKLNHLTCWIAEELNIFGHNLSEIAIIGAPYKIGSLPVGSFAILVPKRVNYRLLFGLLENFAKKLSEILSKSVAKLKIPFGPGHFSSAVFQESKSILLENKSGLKTTSFKTGNLETD